MSRYNRHRRDGNHKLIVDRLRQLGCSVRDCSQLGDEGPDILVGMFGRDYQIEIKTEGQVPKFEQQEWHNSWRGQRPTVMWTVEQAEAWVTQLRRMLFGRKD